MNATMFASSAIAVSTHLLQTSKILLPNICISLEKICNFWYNIQNTPQKGTFMRTDTLQEVYNFAHMYARNNRVNCVQPAHVLFGLVNVENPAKDFLAQFGMTAQNLEPRTSFHTGAIFDSRALQTLDARSARLALEMGTNEVDCIHTLLAILTMDGDYACDKIDFFLKNIGKTRNDFFKYVVSQLPNKQKLVNYTMGVDDNLNIDISTALPDMELATTAPERHDQNVFEFGVDLTQKAMLGKIDQVVGRDEETARVIQTLIRRTKNNPVLVGEAGVGKTAVVEGLALKIAQGQVPHELQGKKLVELDLASMLAGTRFRGDFEERIKNIIAQVMADKDVILFIDEIHNLVGAGGTSEGSLDAAEILKPALARGELRIIGATTLDEYHKYIERDPALERRFQPVVIAEPTPELAVTILRGVKSKYENYHSITITDEAIVAAVQLSVRYITDRFLPDKAFDVLDEACSKLKISKHSVPPQVTDLTAKLARLKRQIDNETNQNQLAELQKAYRQLSIQLENAQQQYQAYLKSQNIRLTAEDVRQVVSQMTGVPVTELSREERDKLVHLEEELSKRVIGQSQAVKVVSLAVRRQRAGLKDPNKPIGSFIFVGPTGSGKTELTKALADCLFGSDSDVIRIDMSEYMEKQSTAKLIGAPPGYVGYEEGGYLTEKVHRKPYSVVLFDEIEKAHPDVFNLLLQILDEGRLTDSHGKTIDFRNTVIIMTSNIGVTDTKVGGMGFAPTNDYNTMHDNVEKALKKFFRPEFLNRVDEIVVFNYLGKEETLKITELLCFGLVKRLRGTLNLRFTDKAIELLAAVGFDKDYGARPLKRAIQRYVEDALAEQLLEGKIAKGDTVVVDAQNNKISFYKQ